MGPPSVPAFLRLLGRPFRGRVGRSAPAWPDLAARLRLLRRILAWHVPRSLTGDLVLVAGAVAVIWGSVFLLLHQQRSAALRGAAHDTAELARALQETTRHAVAEVDGTLRAVQAVCGADPAHCNLAGWARSLRATDDLIPRITLHGPGEGPPAGTPGVSESGLSIGRPVDDRATGHLLLPFSRRLTRPDGSTAAVVTAMLDPTALARFYDSLDIGPGVMLVIGPGGIICLGAPDPAGMTGDSVAATLPSLVRDTADHGTFLARAAPGRPARLFSFHRLRRYPLTVAVGLDLDAVLAPYRARRAGFLAGAVLLTLLLLCFGLALVGRKRRLLRSQQLLTDTLENISQGVLMVSPDRRVPVMNRRVVELLDLPAHLTHGNPRFDAILQWQLESGEFGPGGRCASGFRRFVESGGIDGQHAVYERTRRDGRTLEVRTQRLSNGGAVRTYTDVTERRAARARITYLAHHDGLTGAANRVLFQERLEQAITDARATGSRFAVLCLDLDRFKLVNDLRGHAAGDMLLIQAADRLRQSVGPSDVVARLGGDEFVILQAEQGQPEAAARLARELVHRLAEPYRLDGQQILIGASIGVALYPAHGESTGRLLNNADIALYGAKRGGRGGVRFFEPEMAARLEERRLLEADLRDALALGQISLRYQPVCDVQSRRAVGLEALMRWDHPRRGVVAPADFIPLAEESGLIAELGLWALETACAAAASWPVPARIAVNLSPVQFLAPDLSARIAEVLDRTALPPERLLLEVTEGVLIADADRVQSVMESLQAQGIRLALDDFGTGHAGLSYLRRFPFDTIKVDQSFVEGLTEDEHCRAIVQATLALAGSLGLDVVAEGVETEAQLTLLRRMGCPFVQGFLLGRPILAGEATELLAAPARPAVPAR